MSAHLMQLDSGRSSSYTKKGGPVATHHVHAPLFGQDEGVLQQRAQRL